MSSRTEALAGKYNIVDYRILPKGILQVPVDPSRKELSLKNNRDKVADHNTDPKHIEGTLWGSPHGCHTENPNFIVLPQELGDGRIMAAGQPAPYFERATLTVATPRSHPSRETLLAPQRAPVVTTLAGDLPERTRRAYTAIKLAGFETAVRQSTDDTTPIVIEHHVPFVSNGRPVCRTVPDPHSTGGLVDNPKADAYELPKAHQLEQEILTPELVTGLAVSLQGYLRTALKEQHIDPEQIQIMPHVEEPNGPCVQYLGINKDNITDPDSISLVSKVARSQLRGYREVVFPQIYESLPDAITTQGETFTPLKTPAYREIMHMTPHGELASAISPIIVYSSVGGMEACGVKVQRGEEFPRRHTEETVFQFRQETGKNMEKALAQVR